MYESLIQHPHVHRLPGTTACYLSTSNAISYPILTFVFVFKFKICIFKFKSQNLKYKFEIVAWLQAAHQRQGQRNWQLPSMARTTKAGACHCRR